MFCDMLISGALSQSARNGGLAWCFLQFALGFKRLGCEVLFLDRLSEGMCADQSATPIAVNGPINVRYFVRVMEAFGFRDSFSLSYNRGEQAIGLPRDKVLKAVREAACLINVMG